LCAAMGARTLGDAQHTAMLWYAACSVASPPDSGEGGAREEYGQEVGDARKYGTYRIIHTPT
jgi:hypothetical protein